MRPNLMGLHLKRDQRHCAIEQADDIQEAARDVLRDEHCAVLVLRIALPLDVPVFDGANDVSLISCSELKLDFCQGLGEADRGGQLPAAGAGDPEAQRHRAPGSRDPQRSYPRPTFQCILSGFSAKCVRVWYRQEKASTHLWPNYTPFRLRRASYPGSYSQHSRNVARFENQDLSSELPVVG